MRLSKKLSIVFASAVLLAGCKHSSTSSSTFPVDSPTPSVAGVQPPSSASGEITEAVTTRPVARLKTVARIPLPGESVVASVQVFGDWVTWTACLPHCTGRDSPNTLFVASLVNGKVRQVARTTFPHGDLERAVGAGNYLAWVDKDREFSDDDWSSVWQMQVMDLSDGSVWTAASSGGVAAVGAPWIEMDGTTLAWMAPGATNYESDLRVIDLISHRAWTVVSNIPAAGGLEISGSNIVYDADDAGSSDGDPLASHDIFVVPISGGAPSLLTDQHHVTLPSAADGWITWATPRNGDGTQVWIAKIGGPSTPRVIFDGGNVQRSIGQRFVALWTSAQTDLLVVAFAADGTPGDPVKIDGTQYIPAHFDADGQYLAYATDIDPTLDADVVTLHVVKVTVS